MAFIITVTVVLILLITNEYWWRSRTVHGELSRKFVHITVGTFVAFWPFFLSWNEIKILSVCFLLGVGLSKYLNLFKAIHSVQRPTWGEIFFAVAVGLVAVLTQDKWIYTTALLQMSLADGLAAIIGVKFGRKHKYIVSRGSKSVAGTLTFFVVSVSILIMYNYVSGSNLGVQHIVLIGAAVSLIENLAVLGLDNLLVPLLVALLLVNY